MSQREISFTVLGIAKGQGSMKAFIGVGKNGAPVARVKPDSAKMVPWRQEVGWCALRARADAGYADVNAFAGRHAPVIVGLMFYIAKPKYLTKKVTWPARKPDLDKLARSVFDAMKGILYEDDGQIVQLVARKEYGLPERVEISVTAI